MSVSFFESELWAGFPSSAEDFIESKLNLNEFLVSRPSSTFFIRVQGDSMEGAGIFSGDMLIVDRSLNAKSENVVVALLNGEFTVKRLVLKGETIFLKPENPKYRLLKVTPEADFQIWGVVTYVIHCLS